MPRPLHAPLAALLLLAATALPSCEALYFIAGKGKQEALYTLPKSARVLVCIDPREASRMPTDIPFSLGESIADHLFKYKAADRFVAQSVLTDVRRQPDYEKLGIADIAKACDADVVLHVDVIQWKVVSTADDSITSGLATVIVKVVDRNGHRMWPPEGSTGVPIDARVEPQLTEQQPVEAVNKRLATLLTIRVARMFHAFDLENKELTQ